ncbi:GNAT family N-acetyltransferase [Sporolactobacillus kofuensis]|uniref:GNAT family N-acetyltransferase n=1 Tax=Sporolactobacillus kofuensis TaxID=269672 RepID=A0ABW1WKJ4_9BACL|nr:GNAT family N-acetyltransferase [Sporolactobacillus kofuensis]MCO7176532.1 GNAT family N-acetyltransferase [Sporolactobacillus kofuensis]
MIHFRCADRTDSELIHSLMVQAFTEYQNSKAPSSAMQETTASIDAAFEKGEQALIACDETTPVGMVRFKVREDVLYFFRLSVIPENQGQGVAKRILQELEEVAKKKNKHSVTCRVRKNVTRNVHLYQSMGYHLFDQEVVHKPDGIDIAVVHMKKKL